MKIHILHIQNYKSLVDLQIIEPNSFTVFAGSNGAGKSNIFEALEFFTLSDALDYNALASLFQASSVVNRNAKELSPISMSVLLDFFVPSTIKMNYTKKNNELQFAGSMVNILGKGAAKRIIENADQLVSELWSDGMNNESHKQFFDQFSRIFIKKVELVKQNTLSDSKLGLDCSNLEKVLKRILKNNRIKEEIIQWLDLLIPGFENIEIITEPLSGTDNLAIYEKGTKTPFNRDLLSDGTWNILALLTSVYQSDEPQFLCIEEPENGLNPKVQKELVNLFRQKCEDEGHYIWLNTHSQTIVNQLESKELILVDKVDGETKIKQLTNFDLHGLRMDEAWLTNSFGGGLPW